MNGRSSLVSFAITTFNQERYIAEALRGAFSQTYRPLEIVVCDDCSTDRTADVIREEIDRYSGPHEIRFYRNERNLGIAGNYSLLPSRTRGRLVVFAAGDDVSLPNRAETIAASYRAAQVAGQPHTLYCSSLINIDDQGNELGLGYPVPLAPEQLTASWLARRGRGPHLIGATFAWDRCIFDVFGPLQEGTLAEDEVLPLRGALLGSIGFIDEPLVRYRLHDSNVNSMYPVQFGSSDHFRKFTVKGLDDKIAYYRTNLADLELFVRRFPGCRDDVPQLQNAVEMALRDALFERQLVGGGLLHRASVMLQALRDGTPKKRIVRWILWYILPSVWIRIVMWRPAVRRAMASLRASAVHAAGGPGRFG